MFSLSFRVRDSNIKSIVFNKYTWCCEHTRFAFGYSARQTDFFCLYCAWHIPCPVRILVIAVLRLCVIHICQCSYTHLQPFQFAANGKQRQHQSHWICFFGSGFFRFSFYVLHNFLKIFLSKFLKKCIFICKHHHFPWPYMESSQFAMIPKNSLIQILKRFDGVVQVNLPANISPFFVWIR